MLLRLLQPAVAKSLLLAAVLKSLEDAVLVLAAALKSPAVAETASWVVVLPAELKSLLLILAAVLLLELEQQQERQQERFRRRCSPSHNQQQQRHSLTCS